uniref:Uncharacterized protein n=1 Tax=Arundo donax TaxID=35708 RepID=A0A0A9GKH7_ARUDO
MGRSTPSSGGCGLPRWTQSRGLVLRGCSTVESGHHRICNALVATTFLKLGVALSISPLTPARQFHEGLHVMARSRPGGARIGFELGPSPNPRSGKSMKGNHGRAMDRSSPTLTRWGASFFTLVLHNILAFCSWIDVLNSTCCILFSPNLFLSLGRDSICCAQDSRAPRQDANRAWDRIRWSKRFMTMIR